MVVLRGMTLLNSLNCEYRRWIVHTQSVHMTLTLYT